MSSKNNTYLKDSKGKFKLLCCTMLFLFSYVSSISLPLYTFSVKLIILKPQNYVHCGVIFKSEKYTWRKCFFSSSCLPIIVERTECINRPVPVIKRSKDSTNSSQSCCFDFETELSNIKIQLYF